MTEMTGNKQVVGEFAQFVQPWAYLVCPICGYERVQNIGAFSVRHPTVHLHNYWQAPNVYDRVAWYNCDDPDFCSQRKEKIESAGKKIGNSTLYQFLKEKSA